MPVRLARTWLGGLRKVRRLWAHALLVPPRRYGPSVICPFYSILMDATRHSFFTLHSVFTTHVTAVFWPAHFAATMSSISYTKICVTAAPTTTRRDLLKVAHEEMSACHVHENKIILYQASEQENTNFVNLWLNYVGPTYVIFMIWEEIYSIICMFVLFL